MYEHRTDDFGTQAQRCPTPAQNQGDRSWLKSGLAAKIKAMPAAIKQQAQKNPGSAATRTGKFINQQNES